MPLCFDTTIAQKHNIDETFQNFLLHFRFLWVEGFKKCSALSIYSMQLKSGLLSKLVVNQVNQLKADLAAIKNSL
jgi:hypothetical protein